ncbi:hypothetical protein BDV96DRAFT_603206 [Lophiotrema nucula]|uniref:Uncharacterized protein n=1 Tax=Lophiotrema nucula TaxID=690887 RepID=A0A6A5YV31_9PLEO|nr:hypothetical protein BDV96DRAFT_603206 [Lophiotrema nucula]
MPKRKYEEFAKDINSDSKLKGDAKALLDLATKVSTDIIKSTSWSMLGIAGYTQRMDKRLKTGETSPAQELKMYKDRWRKARRYGTCVDMAYLAYIQLREALSTSTNKPLRKYFGRVKLMAVELDEKLEHCATVIKTPSFCIVVDISFHLTAFYVPRGGSFNAMEHLGFDGSLRYETYRYSKKGAALSIKGCLSSAEVPRPIFEGITLKKAVEDINFRLGRVGLVEDGKPEIELPPTCYIAVYKSLPKKPKGLPCVETDDGWLATTCQLSISYRKASILVQVPQRDYLDVQKHEFKVLPLEGFGILNQVNTKVANIVLDFKKTDWFTNDHIAAVANVVADLGMKKREFYKIVKALYPDARMP